VDAFVVWVNNLSVECPDLMAAQRLVNRLKGSNRDTVIYSPDVFIDRAKGGQSPMPSPGRLLSFPRTEPSRNRSLLRTTSTRPIRRALRR
jgi:hypothetical protein